MQNKSLLVLLFLWSGIIGTNAQQIFSPGYVVNNSGDTIKGYILDAAYEQLSREITIKTPEKTSAAQELRPTQLKGFGFDTGPHFRSKTVQYYNAPSGIKGVNKIYETRFLRLLENGTVQLYKLENSEINYALYASKNGGPLEQLTLVINTLRDKNSPQIIQSDTVTYLPRLLEGEYAFKRFYYATLQTMFVDCPKARLTKAPELEERVIAGLVRKYNNSCSIIPQPSAIAQRKKRRLTIVAGGMYAGVRYNEQTESSFSPLNTFGSVSAVLAGVHFSNYFASKRFSHEYYLVQGRRPFYVPTERYKSNFTEIRGRFNLLLLPEKRLTPHISLGMSVAKLRKLGFFEDQNEWVARATASAGVQYFFKNRSFIRLETTFPEMPSVSLSYGYKL